MSSACSPSRASRSTPDSDHRTPSWPERNWRLGRLYQSLWRCCLRPSRRPSIRGRSPPTSQPGAGSGGGSEVPALEADGAGREEVLAVAELMEALRARVTSTAFGCPRGSATNSTVTALPSWFEARNSCRDRSSSSLPPPEAHDRRRFDQMRTSLARPPTSYPHLGRAGRCGRRQEPRGARRVLTHEELWGVD